MDVEVSWSFVPEFRNVVLVKGIVSASSQRSPWATGATCPSRGLLRACGLIWWVFAAWVKREPNEKTRCLVMSKLGTGCRRWGLGLLFRQGQLVVPVWARRHLRFEGTRDHDALRNSSGRETAVGVLSLIPCPSASSCNVQLPRIASLADSIRRIEQSNTVVRGHKTGRCSQGAGNANSKTTSVTQSLQSSPLSLAQEWAHPRCPWVLRPVFEVLRLPGLGKASDLNLGSRGHGPGNQGRLRLNPTPTENSVPS